VKNNDRKFVFTRKLNTGDAAKDKILVFGETYTMHKAWGSSDTFN